MEQSELDELYQALILEHSKKPRNFGELENGIYSKGKNPSCGDEIDMYMSINNGKVESVKFKGVGCALCIASTSIFTDLIKNKSIDETENTLSKFINFITKDEPLDIDKLKVFEGVKKFPLRIKCVLLGWRTGEDIVRKYKNGN